MIIIYNVLLPGVATAYVNCSLEELQLIWRVYQIL